MDVILVAPENAMVRAWDVRDVKAVLITVPVGALRGVKDAKLTVKMTVIQVARDVVSVREVV